MLSDSSFRAPFAKRISREAAQNCSPRRKPWVANGMRKPQRGARTFWSGHNQHRGVPRSSWLRDRIRLRLRFSDAANHIVFLRAAASAWSRGKVAVIRFHDQHRTVLQSGRVVQIVPTGCVLFHFFQQLFRGRSSQTRRMGTKSRLDFLRIPRPSPHSRRTKIRSRDHANAQNLSVPGSGIAHQEPAHAVADQDGGDAAMPF